MSCYRNVRPVATTAHFIFYSGEKKCQKQKKKNCCFSNSRRFFCGCFVIINKNDVYEYKSVFNRVTDGMVL